MDDREQSVAAAKQRVSVHRPWVTIDPDDHPDGKLSLQATRIVLNCGY